MYAHKNNTSTKKGSEHVQIKNEQESRFESKFYSPQIWENGMGIVYTVMRYAVNGNTCKNHTLQLQFLKQNIS